MAGSSVPAASLRRSINMATQPTLPEKVELAVYESHDADIPSNAGAVDLGNENSMVAASMEYEAGLVARNGKDLEVGVEPPPPSTSSSKTAPVEEEIEERDTNVVDWEGPEDPENPLNWPSWKRVMHIILVSATTFVT